LSLTTLSSTWRLNLTPGPVIMCTKQPNQHFENASL
jgi:hypothetical protein